jgi:segregation and condensation protein A
MTQPTPDTAPDQARAAGSDYKVQLDVYSGPLELLLYLIRRDEVDIKNIPIARITEQYLKHVEIIRRIDINLAGDFLVMAATLMEIKSRMLIPAPKVEPGAEGATTGGVEELTDPRYELVKQLLAYKEFKDAAGDLKRRAAVEAARYPRAVPRPTGRAPLEIEDLDLFRLIDAFNGIMASVGHSAYGHEVLYDDTPISLHQADILDRLAREAAEEGKTVSSAKGVTLRQLFEGRKNKSEMIGVFLATLELIRQKKVAIEQVEGGDDIRLRLRDDSETQVLFQAETAGHGEHPSEPQPHPEPPEENTGDLGVAP